MSFTEVLRTQSVIAIVDNNDGTNDAEKVIKTLGPGPELRVVYRDTNGVWDELRHDGKAHFLGFSPLRETDMAKAIDKLEWPDELHPSHITRISDASSFDEICVNCGATDITGGGWGGLRKPCPNPKGFPNVGL